MISSRTLSAIRYRVLWRSLFSRTRRHFTQRQRVGIGPVRNLPQDAVIGPRVLMVADWLNSRSAHFQADLFFHSRDVMKRHYDAVIIVKNFDDFSYAQLRTLRTRGTQLIYSIADNPSSGSRSYYDEPEFLDLMDAVIAANPLQVQDLGEHSSKARLIPAPLRNTTFKRNYSLSHPVKIIWQGYIENASLTRWLHPLFERLSKEVPGSLELIYHANRPVPLDGIVRFQQWQPDTWEQVLISSDIAIAVKPPDNWYQARKPPTKVLTYMAAGVPTVCTPSEADLLVVRHGENALIAHSEEEWHHSILTLCQDESLRKRIARRAIRDALRFASPNKVGQAHEELLLDLTGGADWRRI